MCVCVFFLDWGFRFLGVGGGFRFFSWDVGEEYV